MALSAGVLLAVLRQAPAPILPSLLWPDPPRLGDFRLHGADGKPLTGASLDGHWTLLFFGFTHCPDVCPSTLATLKQVRKRLVDNASFADKGQVLFVSLDPTRDTPEKLGEYVRYFDPSFLAATGDDAQLDALARPLGVIRAKVDGPNGDYTLDHTASIFLVDPERRVIGLFGLPHEAARIATDADAIIRFGGEHP